MIDLVQDRLTLILMDLCHFLVHSARLFLRRETDGACSPALARILTAGHLDKEDTKGLKDRRRGRPVHTHEANVSKGDAVENSVFLGGKLCGFSLQLPLRLCLELLLQADWNT